MIYLFEVILSLLRYIIMLRLQKERKSISGKETLFSSKLIWKFILEVFILLPHPNPLFTGFKK